MENLTEKELEILKEKARKYDELDTKVYTFYEGDDDLNHEADLGDLGAHVAEYFGYL